MEYPYISIIDFGSEFVDWVGSESDAFGSVSYEFVSSQIEIILDYSLVLIVKLKSI